MNTNRNKQVEDILGSLDGSQRAAVPDFFYTRLKARMEGELEHSQPLKKSWVLRPAFAITALAVVLVINAFVILKNDTARDNATNDAETIQTIAAEYSLNDNAAVYDLNQDK